ncbi:MAG: SH3 domain-containing protein [Anaerolineales bacterium]|nr:SH3 domain-containing protein [Anaerolineales bacterium]MCA9977662.1 SH3 domain-containing protein [Anaerolineales bacterium]MCB8968407.1 SH3 domain-containing protein [Ardenticatenaceae bacterium]
MARYQVPPDPRDPETSRKRPRRQRRDQQEPIPWLWLGLGGIVTIIAIGVAILIANSLLSRPQLTTTNLPEPTIILLTAPPSPTVVATRPFPTPTTIPTFTPVPTPDLAQPPDEVTIGYYAQVVETGGVGVTVRGGPSTSNVRITIASEGAIVFILDGPMSGDDLLWWQIRLTDGTEGWVAGDYLTPAAAP